MILILFRRFGRFGRVLRPTYFVGARGVLAMKWSSIVSHCGGYPTYPWVTLRVGRVGMLSLDKLYPNLPYLPQIPRMGG